MNVGEETLFHGLIPIVPKGWPKNEPLLLLHDVRCLMKRREDDARTDGRREAVERMQAMRRDYRTMSHAEFPIKWPDWREYDEVLPTNCSCRECTLWRSGS